MSFGDLSYTNYDGGYNDFLNQIAGYVLAGGRPGGGQGTNAPTPQQLGKTPGSDFYKDWTEKLKSQQQTNQLNNALNQQQNYLNNYFTTTANDSQENLTSYYNSGLTQQQSAYQNALNQQQNNLQKFYNDQSSSTYKDYQSYLNASLAGNLNAWKTWQKSTLSAWDSAPFQAAATASGNTGYTTVSGKQRGPNDSYWD